MVEVILTWNLLYYSSLLTSGDGITPYLFENTHHLVCGKQSRNPITCAVRKRQV